MNEFLKSFVDAGMRLALLKGLSWDVGNASTKQANKAKRWNLTALAGQVPPPTLWLSDFEFSEAEQATLRETAPDGSKNSSIRMSEKWADLCKSVVLDEILIKKNKPQHALVNVARPLRILALCAQDTSPSDITPDQIKLAYNVAIRIGSSGKVASNLKLVVKNVLDVRHIANLAPLARYCLPYATEQSLTQHRVVLDLESHSNTYRRTDRQRKELSDRKASDRLPDERAFWELMRIVYTERPKTFSDALRFEQVKLGIATGMRVGETILLPEECLARTQYTDPLGRSAGSLGGMSTSLSLRYFAEKQPDDEKSTGVHFFESLQHVPALLEGMTQESVERARKLTAPMRTRLRLQIATGRIFPELEGDSLIPLWDMYTRVSGSIYFGPDPLPSLLIERYRETYNSVVLEEIREWQQHGVLDFGPGDNVRKYWSKFTETTGVQIVDAQRRPLNGSDRWRRGYLCVGAVERAIHSYMRTKLSDTTPFPLKSGSLSAADILFLMPIRALFEGRNGGILDVNRYAFVGRASTADIQLMLSDGKRGLFARYGRDDETRSLKMVPHSIRHLQNAELFRVGVSDALITKRFGRRSVTQSHAYDHRSLAEDLARVDLPETAASLGDRTKELAKLIVTKKVRGPIVEEFLRVQAELGDQAAFDYLEAEADGLHVTPYGLCVNSFVVDPCPKHLECFNGCRHLTRTNVVSERDNLKKLLDMTMRVESNIRAVPEDSRNVGWENQLQSIATRVKNIRATLAAEPNTNPFPDGPDLFVSIETPSPRSILDGRPREDIE